MNRFFELAEREAWAEVHKLMVKASAEELAAICQTGIQRSAEKAEQYYADYYRSQMRRA